MTCYCLSSQSKKNLTRRSPAKVQETIGPKNLIRLGKPEIGSKIFGPFLGYVEGPFRKQLPKTAIIEEYG